MSPRAKSATKRSVPEDQLSRREILSALRALKRGDFSHRMRDDLVGQDGQICETFNDLAQRAASIDAELAAVAHSVGREGRTKRRARKGPAAGGWANYIASFNQVLGDLTAHSNEMARVVTAVYQGDLTQRITSAEDGQPLRGQFLEQARAVDRMVELLSLLGSEVTHVAREVGVKGQLGAQADVDRAQGAWKELTDTVNLMASNLTSQVREIARVTTAVAQGDLSKTVNIEVKGEILELKNTINTMVGQLSSFADEVTRVAREVGTEGRLGGQAQVPGVSGVWRELTENVNSMADNLTSQVRNIADVTTAVANGDLSREDHRRGPRRDSPAEEHHQRHGRLARLFRRRGHAHGTRGRHRRRSRRPGPGARRLGRVEGADRQRQLDGEQPDQPGAKHRRGRERSGERRPLSEDHRRRTRRGSRPQGHHQRHGGPAERLRRGGHARRTRGRRRRQARRPGRGRGRARHLEGADRQRQPDGQQPDQPGARHRRGHHRRGARAI